LILAKKETEYNGKDDDSDRRRDHDDDCVGNMRRKEHDNNNSKDHLVITETCTSFPYLHNLPLQPMQVKLCTYTGKNIPVLGELLVNVDCQR